ncbi:MAG: TonB-dependent receptor [candidate division KSB1 bacterium]|nr:TonB-dependent receptor [candidate division KSB1 bacterium]MDZ7273078.1 TonB-dependent receptor [candidate division KSB1 bacterium]MDZ7285181.1 TonB-dependent receptor [candidate division KSB1 bacterium]MDZ7298213.1 TonB-dependent receptor [candidate division KSB1 bacterium]MDZ7306887.1 TonB-dependent receptor [candidate division KSB1 bacterium]
MRKIFWLLLLHVNVASLAQSAGRIEGRVVDARTGEPLAGANVLVVGTNLGASADAGGFFVIPNLAPGTYLLRFSFLGYESLTKTDVVVSAVRPAIVNVQMVEGSLQRQEVVVTPGYFAEARTSPVSTTQLAAEEIRRFPGGFEDIVRTAATLPGVAVVNEGGRNDLLVRGGGPTENLYLINNLEVPNLNHFGTQGSSSGALSFVNLDFIDRVEFSTGGFGVRYGDKMSSVLALDTRPGRRDRPGGEATISATQFGLNLEGPLLRRGDFLFSARQSYLDLIFRAAGLPFIPVYTDFNLITDYEFSPRSRLSFLALVALDRVDRDQSSLKNRVTNAGILDNTQNQIITGATWRRVLGRGFFDLTASLNYNGFRFSQIDEYEREYFNSRADETELHLKLTSQLGLSRGGSLSAGLAVKHIINDNTAVFADTIYDRSGRRVAVASLGLPAVNVAALTTRKYAAHAEWQQPLLPWFNFTFGLRGDLHAFLDRPFYPAARLAVGFQPVPSLKFKTSAGRYYQSPSHVWVVNSANRALRAMRNDMVVFGVEYLLRPEVNLSLEAYYKRYRDLPTGTLAGINDYFVLTNTGVGYGGREDDFQSFGYFPLASQGRGRAHGFEVLLQKRFSEVPCYGQLSLAYNQSEYTAANGVTHPGQFDQRWIFNLSGGYVFNAKWEISGKFRFYTGAPYTPVYLPSQNGGKIQNLPEEYLSRRLAAGHHLDMRVDRRFHFSGWAMILFLDIQNLYNNPLPRRPRYDFWENRIDDRDALGLLPSLGISAAF